MASPFKAYVESHNLQTWGSVAQFASTRIAIDAEDYLAHLLTNPQTREPLLPALGGLPFALQKHVDNDLKGFREAGVEVVWVFNGLEGASRSQAVVGREGRKASEGLSEAWAIYDQGRGDEAVVAFGKNCTYKTYHITRYLLSHLHVNSQTVLVAPYTAAAQCVYLESTAHVDAIVGSASLLVFGAEKVLTTFDFANKRVAWVDLKTVLGKFMLNKPAFDDLMLLSGCVDAVLPALPELENGEAGGVARIQAARAILQRFNLDGHAAVMSQSQSSKPAADSSGITSSAQDYLESFRKAKYAIRHAVHLTSSGSVTPVNADKVPNDAHEFIGQRLPEEVYYYLSRGLVGPRVLNWRTRMAVYETPPLDGVGGQVYRSVVQGQGVRGLRAQALALLTKSLHRYYQKTDVDLICWFNESDKRPLGLPDLSEPSAAADTWHVKPLPPVNQPANDTANGTSASRPFLDPAETPVLFTILALSDDTAARATKTPYKDTSSILSESRDLLANTTWRFLHDRGYINPDHTLSAWGKVLATSLKHAATSSTYTSHTLTPHESEEAILMAYELLRLDLLNSKHLFPSPPFSGPPLRGSESDKSHTLLVSRIAALGLFRHAGIGYTGPLSRHLLAYHQIASVVRGALRDLLEMHAANLFLSGSADRKIQPSTLTEIGCDLPFVREPDLGLSLVVKSYLDELSNEPGRRSDVTKWFNHAIDIGGDLEKAWAMWEAVNAGVQSADISIVSNETRNSFSRADDWLQKKRASAASDGTNGSV